MTALLVALAVGIACYVAVVFLFPKAVPEDTGDLTKQALNRIYDENFTEEGGSRNVLRDSLNESDPLVRIVFGNGLMQPMYEAAIEAGLQSTLKQFVMVILAVILLSGVIAMKMGMGVYSPIIALVLGYYLPLKYCQRRVKKRNLKFIEQFPDALDIIVRSVRSGFPLSIALQMIAENAENPVREEFRQVVDEIALGRNLQDALARLAMRINEPDIRFFVVVLTVQQETGGNLAEIIGNLSGIIRKRKQLRFKVRAMTSEGRATGWVLGSLPVIVFLALYFVQRDYVAVLWTVSMGKMLALAILALIGICAVVIKQMTSMEI